ncbi:hypothetical protein HY857_01085 [Candidatus Saccharibacteria bacterium]|nr:hypothetical protein [Candidatus Saccharibacteria bacterium]
MPEQIDAARDQMRASKEGLNGVDELAREQAASGAPLTPEDRAVLDEWKKEHEGSYLEAARTIDNERRLEALGRIGTGEGVFTLDKSGNRTPLPEHAEEVRSRRP